MSGDDPLRDFLPSTAAWFRSALGEPTPPQRLAWPHIAAGEHTLVTAPTGSGKTLTAFLSVIDRLNRELSAGQTFDGIDVVYVSPLKALNTDIEANLRVPLEGIRAVDPSLSDITVAVRSGDTTPSERQRMIRRPPHILITTPESLYLYLTAAKSRATLRNVRTVIIDEVHAVCGSKRGVHLGLSLERLDEVSERDRIQRIGLSATIEPLDEAARFLGGANRQVEIVDASRARDMHLEVVGSHFGEVDTVWDEITASLTADIEGHDSTLIFVNNRAGAERLVGRLNDVSPGSVADTGADDRAVEPGAGQGAAGERGVDKSERQAPVRAHHGSVSHEVRAGLEADLKAGKLDCLVATGTLELGIDMGAIDLVAQVESPKSVARGLQRVGRSGHLVGARASGRIYPLYRSDLAEVAALARAMRERRIEATRFPRNCLDVLAQQLVAEVAGAGEADTDTLFALVRRSAPYATLTRPLFDAVLTMLAGETKDPDLASVKPRIVWDRGSGVLRPRPGAKQVAVTSGGTIPDRGLFPVYLAGSKVRLGELDEEFVFESKPGDVFALGTSLWRVAEIGRDRVFVTEAPGAVPRMPFWRGEGIGRPASLGVAVGKLLSEIEVALAVSRTGHPVAGSGISAAVSQALQDCALDELASEQLVRLVEDQAASAGVPTDTRVIVEAFNDEVGDWRIVIHSVFGTRVNRAWALALSAKIRERLDLEVETVQTDDGVMMRFPNLDGAPPADLLGLVRSDEVEATIAGHLAESALFASRFRENAQRALLLPRNRPGTRTPLWLQRLRAADLMVVAQRDPDFPVVLETYRELLEDELDLTTLRRVLHGIETGEVELHYTTSAEPSPLASGMLWRFVFDYLYQGDAPKAETQAAQLRLNRDLLADLLGGTALRELLDPAAIDEATAHLTRTAPGWQARDPDELVDLLRRFGDLDRGEIADRYAGDPGAALASLGGRACEVGSRWVVAEEAGEYAAVLDGSADPGEWLRRAALGRGIFQAAELSTRYGLASEIVLDVLAGLADAGVLVRGEIMPGGTGEDWVGAETLKRMHRRTLAGLRRSARPVDAGTYARFLLGRQGVMRHGPRLAGANGLERCLELLEGAPLHADIIETEVLPSRVDGYQPQLLDALLASGRWVWVGFADRRVAFVRPENRHLVESGNRAATAAGSPQLSAAAGSVAEFLGRGGGWRTSELAAACNMDAAVVDSALDALVWAGAVTNDSFVPPSAPRVTPRSAAVGSRRRRRTTGTAVTDRRAGRAGRWSAFGGGLWGAADARSEESELLADAADVAEILGGRYGVITRAAWASERWAVPWAAVSEVLTRAEAGGDLRRGYFVEGLPGLQHAAVADVDALRRESDDALRRESDDALRRESDDALRRESVDALRRESVDALRRESDDGEPIVVATADPANPWGLLFEGRGVRRAAGALCVLEAGVPLLGFQGTRVTPLSDRPAEGFIAGLSALGEALASRRGKFQVDTWGQVPLSESAVAREFASAGWRRTPKGFAPGRRQTGR